jgi:putative endonuclease
MWFEAKRWSSSLNPFQALCRLADRIRYAVDHEEGRRGEDLAHRYLRRRGFTVVARNWRPPQGGGEIDLVAWEGETLVFIEVKTRVSDMWGAPERAIDAEKMDSLRRTARDYARRAGVEEISTRFDVIAISGEKLNHLQDAFGEATRV